MDLAYVAIAGGALALGRIVYAAGVAGTRLAVRLGRAGVTAYKTTRGGS